MGFNLDIACEDYYFCPLLQGYYGITSDMNSDLMLKISAENRQTKELCIEEEIHRHMSLRPLHIWISR